MSKLCDRMMRADSFTDGRLIRVSREARLLALVLDALAEPTGCLRFDVDEIRGACPFYLADSEGKPPTRDEIRAWIQELCDAKWALTWTVGTGEMLYLLGFWKRQTGENVCIGAVEVNGAPKPHLPIPACVRLMPKEERGKLGDITVRKYLPVHCDQDYTGCPCEWYPHGTPTMHEPYPQGEEIERDLKERDSKEFDSEVSQRDVIQREGNAGRGAACVECGGTGKLGMVSCPHCQGTGIGIDHDRDSRACPQCGGTGRITTVQHPEGRTCPHCAGSGLKETTDRKVKFS